MAKQKVLIIPGNGCGKIEKANWYAWLAAELIGAGCEVPLRSMPDPDEAKEVIWLPFIRDVLGCDEDTIVVGHSSGAVAAMRLLEKTKVKGVVLVSACWTDLGMPSEAISGYYARDWPWKQIAGNADWIVQLASSDDPFIPIEEMRFVAKSLQTEYIEKKDEGHFMTQTFPELKDIVLNKIDGKL
mmetsp:Transcript_27972/g.55072  ORF Transcript_27972/g.55072 Transcript_27972/m.55072 type:complete len:185 (-) Transcript_27972:175-729(-)|eukprot:CAMPEP_0175155516 /NCGR_PEP_ID=MMETSP0087-20121206/21027_1 /TAXON_ID=136419 /ORGANISM="Unknown Unknown, Strain D1" /LENGTH=184 /DNA_ID=CAMNT_0016442697 /DNA_START=32 /DNA_END=586 /DNA_ORIENTATION=-